MADSIEVVGLAFETDEAVRNIKRFERELDRLEDQVDQSGKAAAEAERRFDGWGRAVVALAAAYGGLRIIQQVGGYVFRANVEFEELQARLNAVTGSATEGQAAFEWIADFAKKTTFDVSNLVEAFTTLQAAGLDPTAAMMRDLGEFAAAMGRDITDAVQAILRGAQGGTERLREGFFIPIEKDGETLRITWRGVTTEVAADAEAMIEHFRKIGREDFGGTMERQMDDMGRSTANLADTIALLAKEIGDAGLNQEVAKVTQSMDAAIQNTDGLARALGGGLAWALREVAAAGEEWLLIAGDLFGDSPAVVGAKASLGKVDTVETLQKRYLDFIDLLPRPDRSIDENDRVLDEAGLTQAGVGEILSFIEERITMLVSTGSDRRPGARNPAAPPARTTPADPSQAVDASEVDEAARAIQRLNAALEEQRLRLVKGEEAALRYSLVQDGVVGKAQEQVVELWRTVDGLETKNRKAQEAAREDQHRADAIERILDGLREENMLLEGGEEALLAHQLATLGASEATIAYAESLAQANEEMVTRHEEMERAAQETLSAYEDQMRQIASAADNMAGGVTDALMRVAEGTLDIGDGFALMVERILAEMTRLATAQLILDPLAGFFRTLLGGAFGAATGGLGGAVAGVASVGFDMLGTSAAAPNTGDGFKLPDLGASLPAVSLASGPSQGAGQVVNQTVSLNLSAYDGRDAARFMREQQGEIVRIVGDAVRGSDATRAYVFGG